MDGPLDLAAAQAHLLHDLESRLVLVALADLLVVNNQHRGHQEDEP